MNVVTIDRAAELIGQPARSAMLIALLAGRALTAGELALIGGVSAQNASGHLRKLLRAGLVATELQGRHRYYKLSTPQVGHALEAMAAISSDSPMTRAESPHASEIRFCRTCYDHLAGIVAVAMTSSLLKHRLLRENERDFVVTRSGCNFFAKMGIDMEALFCQRRRMFARRCLDWTERRPHISGALGASILRRIVELKWVASIRGTRAMRLTAIGRELFPQCFRVDLEPLILRKPTYTGWRR